MKPIKILFCLFLIINKAFCISKFKGFDILEKNELEKITINISLDNLEIDSSKLQSLKKALNKSIHTILNNYDEGNQSPLDIFYDTAYFKFSNLGDKKKERINFENFLKADFKSFLNSPETILSLIKTEEENLTNFNLSDFWIFNLKIPTLSDFSFWCVISKENLEPPFLFGMN